MNLKKTTSYSLNVLSFMAKHERDKMSATYLHEKLNIPYSYLRKVLGELSKAGFIRSVVGRTGGFVFSRDISTIYLADIINTTEGLDSFNRCLMGFTDCPFDNVCAMHNLWESSRKEILNVLNNTSLSDLIKDKK